MKNQLADFISYLFFVMVLTLAIWISTFWTDDSLVYRLLYEGI